MLRHPAPLAASLALALATAAEAAEPPAQRIVSMNPSLTAILLALGAEERLVGIDDRSAREEARLAGLPTVGGLFNPSLESVVALAPDRVVLVPSAQQRDLRARMQALGIEVLELPNITLEELLGSIEALGELVDRREAAAERVGAIRAAFAATAQATAGLKPPRVVFALQRDPLYVVGAGSFLDAMLRAAGAVNAGAELGGPYPRAGLEWLIAAAPEVILDSSDDPEHALAYWSRWPSLPAVAQGRVVAVPADEVTLPGPYLDRGLRTLAEAIHGQRVAPKPSGALHGPQARESPPAGEAR
jgi:ABC-type Fe3+-hydroxamate transport system substrate-binding protein